MFFRASLGVGCLFIVLACGTPTGSGPPPLNLAELAARLDALRVQYGVPGMAGAVACDGVVRWSSGFGSADVAGNVPATPETVFHIASLTKTFASVVLFQLDAEGRISLDDHMSAYGVQLAGDPLVRHLMSHTSDAPPGTRFRYDGDRHALLDAVVLQGAGEPFATAVVERVIEPAGLTRTAPSSSAAALEDALAQGYDGAGRAVVYPNNVSTSAGLLSTVLDLVEYVAAIQEGRLYPPGARDLAFTRVSTPSGAELPHGLGWFVDERAEGDVVWHFGSWIGSSALLVLAPSRGATFVLLANNDRLSTPFPIAAGRLEVSPFATAFLGWLEEGEGC